MKVRLTILVFAAAIGVSCTPAARTTPENSRGDTRDIVIVAVTASAMKGDEEVAIAAGCDGYGTKPIDTRSMPALVERYLDAGAKT